MVTVSDKQTITKEKTQLKENAMRQKQTEVQLKHCRSRLSGYNPDFHERHENRVNVNRIKSASYPLSTCTNFYRKLTVKLSVNFLQM